MSGLIFHGVVDKEKKIQESPWTGERRFWILPQDTPGPSVSVPSDSAVEKSGDVSNDGVSEGPSTNSSNPSQYSGGPNTVEKLSQSMEYGPVRLRNWSKGPSNFLFDQSKHTQGISKMWCKKWQRNAALQKNVLSQENPAPGLLQTVPEQRVQGTKVS